MVRMIVYRFICLFCLIWCNQFAISMQSLLQSVFKWVKESRGSIKLKLYMYIYVFTYMMGLLTKQTIVFHFIHHKFDYYIDIYIFAFALALLFGMGFGWYCLGVFSDNACDIFVCLHLIILIYLWFDLAIVAKCLYQ